MHPLIGHLRRGAAFLVIGGLAFLVDAATYNLLVFGIGDGGPMFAQPIPAKVIAIAVASFVTFVGNRLWTFRARNTPTSLRQISLFVLLNLGAMLLQLACLAFSRYVLGLDGVVADNVSGTLIGQALATIFRYFTYDRLVFPESGGSEAGQPVK